MSLVLPLSALVSCAGTNTNDAGQDDLMQNITPSANLPEKGGFFIGTMVDMEG
ncbi:MAG: hypothetical protein IJ325_02670 [Clostridia bacterium]|nr:hypothetical protein [Clostridia bacterium]